MYKFKSTIFIVIYKMFSFVYKNITSKMLHNATDTSRHMHSQYMNRLHKVKKQMQRREVDNLIITDPANMYYLTGYSALSFTTPRAVIINIEKKYPYWFGLDNESRNVTQNTRIPDKNIITYTNYYIQNPLVNPFELLATFLKQNKFNNNVGVEANSNYYTTASHIVLAGSLSNSLKDCTNLVNWIRINKSKYEINSMRIASKIADLAMKTTINNIAMDISQCNVIGELYKVLVANEFSGEFPAIYPTITSGGKDSYYIWNYNNIQFNKSDNIILELAGVHNYYTSPITRTICVGVKDIVTEYNEQIVNETIDNTISAIRPGMTGHDVWSIFDENLSKWGIHKSNSRIGYSVGIGFPPDWNENTISFRKKDNTVIGENMLFHLIGELYTSNNRIKISDTILVTKTGTERLSQLPRDILII